MQAGYQSRMNCNSLDVVKSCSQHVSRLDAHNRGVHGVLLVDTRISKYHTVT